MIRKITSYLRKEFALDLRSLSLMRVLISTVLILDIVIRLSDLKAHYSDEGVLPLKVLFAHTWNEWLFSFHTISSNLTILFILFIIQLIAAFALLIGYRTRLSTIVSWIMLVSLHNRNPMILQGGDDLLRMILFWSMFIPWGAYYAYDSRTQRPKEHMFFNMAILGFIIQVGAVYFFSALLKTSPEWRTENTALYYALSLDQMVLPAGKLIYPYYELLQYMTYFVFRLEYWLPVILLFPFLGRSFRNIAAVSFMFFHIGIGMTLFVGLFFLIGISSSVGLLSGSWIDKLHKKLLGSQTKTEININESPYVSPGIQLALTGLLLYVVAWNFDNTDLIKADMPRNIKAAGYTLRVNQNWGMFAPGVFKDDGWFIFEGLTEKNDTIDLNRFGKKIDYKKPENVVSMFRNDRWRKFSENYLFVHNSFLRPYYASLILNDWNSGNPEKRIKSLKVVYMKEVTGKNYKHSKPVRQVLSELSL